MARLQILQLPPYSPDDQPFALVLDRCDADTAFGADWQRFAEQSGARSFIATDQEVDLDGDTPGVEISDEAVDEIESMIRRIVHETVGEAFGPRPESAGEKAKPRSTWGAGDKPDPRANIPGWEPPPSDVFDTDRSDLIGSAVDKAVGRD